MPSDHNPGGSCSQKKGGKKISRLIADYKKRNSIRRGQSDLCSGDMRGNKLARLHVDEPHVLTTGVM